MVAFQIALVILIAAAVFYAVQYSIENSAKIHAARREKFTKNQNNQDLRSHWEAMKIANDIGDSDAFDRHWNVFSAAVA